VSACATVGMLTIFHMILPSPPTTLALVFFCAVSGVSLPIDVLGLASVHTGDSDVNYIFGGALGLVGLICCGRLAMMRHTIVPEREQPAKVVFIRRTLAWVGLVITGIGAILWFSMVSRGYTGLDLLLATNYATMSAFLFGQFKKRRHIHIYSLPVLTPFPFRNSFLLCLPFLMFAHLPMQ
jgi:hypothetical protein